MTELRLVYEDDNYEKHEVSVTASRFTIGRSTDNDIVIDDSNLSRRHALIDNFDGVYFLSDCGSSNGTKLNGDPVTEPIEIQDGDNINLGDAREFRVKFVEPQAEKQEEQISSKPKTVSIKADASHRSQAKTTTVSGQSSGLSVQTIQMLIGVIAVSVVLIIGALAIVFIGMGGRRNTNNTPPVNINDNNGNVVVENSPQPGTSPVINQPNGNSTPLPTPDPKLNNFEAAAKQCLLKLNTHDKRPYAFPSEKILSEINAKAEQYRGSAQLADALKKLQSNSADLVAKAKNEGMEPGLLIFTALAASDGGKQGDPVAKAHAIFPTLDFVRVTLGEEDVDSSLIVVAAFVEGTGDKKGHPMTGRLARLITKNTLGNRNVWYMREHDGVKPEGYELVLKLIALGAISQNPQLFGVNTPPLTF